VERAQRAKPQDSDKKSKTAREAADSPAEGVLLVTTPLALIAQSAGFFDQSHFSKTFKLLTGQSPAAYRKLLRDR
jgi:AraC-like DNA-binding protein